MSYLNGQMVYGGGSIQERTEKLAVAMSQPML